MDEYLVKFIEWTKLKISLNIKSEDYFPYFCEREIWWAILGFNVGHEQNGKNQNFERPVLVLKKFNNYLFWALPLTSQVKAGNFYYQIEYDNKKGSRPDSVVMIHYFYAKQS